VSKRIKTATRFEMKARVTAIGASSWPQFGGLHMKCACLGRRPDKWNWDGALQARIHATGRWNVHTGRGSVMKATR